MDLTVEMVREWLAVNKAQEPVKALVKELGGSPVLTADTVRPWLETEEGRKVVEPIIDRARTQAVKTHDEKTRDEREAAVKKAIDEAVAKANPKETPLEKEVRDLREKVVKAEQATAMKERQLAWSEKARKKGVDTYLPGDYLPSDLDAADKEADRILAAVEERVTKAKNELLATGSHKPGSGNGAGAGKVDLTKLSMAEAIKLEEAGQLNAQLPAR